VGKLLKGIMNKLFKSNQQPTQTQVPSISPVEVEAIVDAKIKEHAANLQTANQEDYTLTAKQVDYALSILGKIENEFVLAVDPLKLTIKDLNRLIAYQRYKNKGTLINLVKNGVLKRK
jgi:hypothetical protein